jgi:ribosomal protein S18 acetylase RimI-like enzyme
MVSGNYEIERIREVTPGLDEALARLVPLLSPGRRPPSAAELADMLRDGRLHLLAARTPDLDGRILGVVALLLYRVPTGLRARIEDLVVAEEGRNAGIGRSLMEAALEVARASQAHVVDLTCNPRRLAANRLYQELGFTRWETNVYRLVLDGPAAGGKPPLA